MLEQDGMEESAAMHNELRHGLSALASDALAGAARFRAGAGRHGSPD
jgi:enoyl-CoA hydratase